MIKTNLLWVVPRQLTKSVPTLIVTLVYDLKKIEITIKNYLKTTEQPEMGGEGGEGT
jgi:hypothetical protein